MATSKKTALVVLAAGAEEAETVCTVDVLRRGNVDVTVAGLDGDGAVTCSRGVRLLPDASLKSIMDSHHRYDAVVLPGGAGGTKLLRESAAVGMLLKKQAHTGGIIAAICAATTVLAAHDIAAGQRVTSYPSVKDQLTSKYTYDDSSRVVVDGTLITSRGPGTSFEFGLAILKALSGPDVSLTVATGLLLYPGQH